MFGIKAKGGFRETFAVILFLLLPTFLISYFLLWNANQYYAVILKNQAWLQSLYVGIGMAASALFYHFRFRFIPSFAILIFVLYLLYKGVDASAFGEFDTFFFEIQFLIFAFTFGFGWLVGWGFKRLRYFSILISILFLLLCVILLSRQNELFFALNKESGVKDYALIFGPAVLYCVYIIFTSELIYSYRSYDGSIWWSLSKRLTGFIILALILLSGVLYLQKNTIEETFANYGGGGKEGDNSMLKKNKDNTFDLKDYSKLRGSLGRSQQLLFAAHIDNFFPDKKDVPNPLYLTSFYYSKFDTATQTFERDSLIPRNDLFEPDPSKIPLFSTKTDSSVLKDALKDNFRKTIDVEVYKTQLSPSSFVAPSLSFFVQPITIEKDFKKEFRSAYRAKSFISELNSAYFVYNAQDPAIQSFQQMRYSVLSQVKNYNGANKELMNYYTRMPKGKQFDNIRRLADSISKGKTLPIEKVLAVKDYYLAKDENGNAVYSYTDNPGVPDIPNASLLNHFLFESHKGYCAYYAGAGLFLLRAMGIPSRITVGFLTVDRSSKSPGWYWFYADQAHAWVQVFFPGYGWLDFDYTVGNDDARESPQPDGTPPMQPPKVHLATDGVVKNVDTLKKKVSIETRHFVFQDKEYQLTQPYTLDLDLSIASIQLDSVFLDISQVTPGDSATAVSYAEVFKNMNLSKSLKAEQVIQKFVSPAPMDELHIKKVVKKDKDQEEKHKQQIAKINKQNIVRWAVGTLSGLLLFFLMLPTLTFLYLKFRRQLAKSIQQKAYWSYRTAGYYAHMIYRPKNEETYLQYAQDIDKNFNADFSKFMNVYLKLKFAGMQLNEQEAAIVEGFLVKFLQQMRHAFSFKKRLLNFLKVFRSIAFWGIIEK